jgi:hypothetical protein
MDLTIVDRAILNLVDRFLDRQHLVFDLLQEIRPDFFGKAPRPTKAYISARQRGTWGRESEWMYYVHGGGARIVHVHSDEPIEWDSPDLLRFDPNWFAGWVEWWLRRKCEEEQIRQVIELELERNGDQLVRLIRDSLDSLEQHGVLRYFPDRTNSYERIES